MISGSLSPQNDASSGLRWRVATNTLNKESQTADNGGPPAWGLGKVLTTPHRKNTSWYETPIQ